MSPAPNEPDHASVDTPEPTEEVRAVLRAGDVERLDIAASRRGIDREEMLAQAVDAFLAKEMWSGGFIAPPPPMEPPGRFAWSPKAFRLFHRD